MAAAMATSKSHPKCNTHKRTTQNYKQISNHQKKFEIFFATLLQDIKIML